jgi:hypothetical protein
MITIRTMAPMPINMGSSRMRTGLAGRSCVNLAGLGWAGAGAVAVCPGPCWGWGPGGRVGYFLKTSLIFSPACLRSPLA